MINNRISNLLSRIRNTLRSSHNGWIIDQRSLYNSKELLGLLAKLGELGYVRYEQGEGKGEGNWYLISKPNSTIPILGDIKGISKSGKRIYRSAKEIRENELVRSSFGFFSGSDFPKKGGELLLNLSRGNQTLNKREGRL